MSRRFGLRGRSDLSHHPVGKAGRWPQPGGPGGVADNPTQGDIFFRQIWPGDHGGAKVSQLPGRHGVAVQGFAHQSFHLSHGAFLLFRP